MSDLDAKLQELTNASIAAIEAEVGLALYLLAKAVREEHPEARTFTISDSDQGPWMALDEPEVDDEDYAFHLYDERREIWAPYVTEALGGRHSTRDVIDIDKVLADAVSLTGEETG